MNALKIFSDSPLSASAVTLLKNGVAPHEVLFPAQPTASVLAKAAPDPATGEADIAFGQPDVAAVLGSERLRWVHISSAGYTRYDTPEFRAAAKARGLLVSNSSAVYAGPCAEHVFAFMLAQCRALPAALQSSDTNGSSEWNRLRDACVSLRHQEVLLLGFGAIAVKLVELLRPFEVRMTALRRRPTGREGIPVITREQLPAALARANQVVNILPASAETVRFISAERLSQMKRGAAFYNIGRGTTVDQDALLAALRSGRLAAAWLDVTDPEPLPEEHPLRAVPHCHITPHIAGGHRNESESLVRHFLANFHRFLDGAPLEDRIM